jgi:leucyl-tRNA synthetase
LFNQGTIVYAGGKMSKSRGNVVAPDEYVTELGADAVRAYLMFVGPWSLGGEWRDSGIVGISRWLNRVWGLVGEKYSSQCKEAKAERELLHLVHKTVKRTTEDMEKFRFNTMLAGLMEYTNSLSKAFWAGNVSQIAWDEAIRILLLLLAPSTPHLAEELWMKTGRPYSIHCEEWPGYDKELAKEEEVTLAVQINGKLRDKMLVSASLQESEAKQVALGRDRVKAYTKGKTITRVVYVPRRVVNIVAK